MKSKGGLWIDHRKAVVVRVTDEDEETRRIPSKMEKHVLFAAGSSEAGSAEDVRDRQFANHLNKFYDDVIACIRDAETIQIVGPGEAKAELEQRLKNKGLGQRVAGLETVDKLTDRQIEAKVRQRFPVARRRIRIAVR